MTITASLSVSSSSFSSTPIKNYGQRSSSIISPNSVTFDLTHRRPRRLTKIYCEIAIESDLTTSSSSSSSVPPVESEDESNLEKVGARVRVKVPLKVYHVPKVPEIDISGMEGKIKQYVGVWKGKRISANLPFKIEFFTEIEGRGLVKFVSHLKEDEFEYIE